MGAEAKRGQPSRSSDSRVRLFVAVPVADGLLDHVRAAQAALPASCHLRLLGPDQLHVTLAFIGEVEPSAAAEAAAVVATVPSGCGGEARLADCLLLPSPARARVIALAVDDAAGVFAGLYERVMSGLEAAAVMRREKRPFRPHLTIARLRMPTALQPKAQCESAPYPVSSVCLYRSELSREGARYTVLTRTTLETVNGPRA